jgi:type IV pilus assembly protein PilC
VSDLRGATAVAPPPPAVGATRPAEVPWYKREIRFGRAVKPEELMNFSRQAASFLRAGIPVLDALEIVAEEGASEKMTSVLRDMRQRLLGGSSLGEAMAAHKDVFPEYYTAMVRSSELTGRLDDVLDLLAGYIERDVAARRKVKSALTYPAIVMALAVVAVFVMAIWVLPKFEDLYDSLDAKLPLITRLLLGSAGFVATWWWAIFLFFGLAALGSFIRFSGEAGKGRRDALVLKLPAIGPLVHYVVVERFCRVLAALVDAGVPLPDAIQVSSDATNNRVFQAKLVTVRESMMRGEGLARPIADSGMFPAAARQMMRVGESTGSLDQQLHAAAVFYERELDYRLKKATDLIEPIVIVIVGIVVGVVAVAQVAAMYSIFNQIN